MHAFSPAQAVVVGRLAGTAGPLWQDVGPAAIVSEFLTSAQYGVGFPAAALSGAALFGASGASSYQTYGAALGLGLSPALTAAEAANAILSRWLKRTNGAAAWSGSLLKIVPYGDQAMPGTTASGATVTYLPNVTLVYDLTDDDFPFADGEDPVRIARSDPCGVPNVQRVECSDRRHGYSSKRCSDGPTVARRARSTPRPRTGRRWPAKRAVPQKQIPHLFARCGMGR
ncbi:phage tail protein [Methylobacterium sp. J-077]|uniref:phage tail protein n=1 Tax=Methylobacterium sp. J-077 TaxID=2836656 RepID=UPI001FBA89B3|nr:phage tail protein [Methylobacterium sp. J-077]MCJ2121059.1 phage tail protein [Methylobacterium sp. J-077]